MADGSHEMVTAPIGWGWKPGTMLCGDPVGALPELPLLSRVSAADRNRVIAEAITSIPGLADHVRPCHLQAKYAIPQASASVILARTRGEAARDPEAATIGSRILAVLRDGPSTTGEVAAELDLKSSLASTHLLQLQQRGKVERKPFGNGWLWSVPHG
jgi:predicted Rossmann fold nucleotide-binding protein DprA/Smf involved in DNA uptake